MRQRQLNEGLAAILTEDKLYGRAIIIAIAPIAMGLTCRKRGCNALMR